MEYNFKNVVEAWSVLYDDLGREEKDQHNISDFYQVNPRGRDCNETIGLTITIYEPQNCLMWSKIRSLSPIYLAKEWKWYQDGFRDLEHIPSNVWKGLANKSGDEINLINSNYGHYIFTQKDNKFPDKSVYDATIELIKNDNNTRHAIWQIPIMKYRGNDDTPCTSSIQFLLRDNKLNAIVYMRSCDIWFGAANDFTQFILWQMQLAKDLNVELGWFKYIGGSFHCYKENFINDIDKYIEIMNTDVCVKGKQGLSYFRLYDDRDYRIIYDEIIHDFNILINDEIKKEDKIKQMKNEQLIYMLKNMNVSPFIH